MSKIELIKIIWSENGDLNRFAGQSLPFAEFERRARSVARDVGTRAGYDKTKVTAILDTGDTITFRCDLAEDDDHGAASVVRSYKGYIAEHPQCLTADGCMGGEAAAAFHRAINDIEL